MSSKKQLEANRENAKRSTGPKTPLGKKNVRLNAFKHGLYAREMIIRPESKTEVDALQRDLHAQLIPKTTLQKLAFKAVVYCAWQCELAARLDTRRINDLLVPSDVQESSCGTDRTPMVNSWFAASPEDLRKGLRFLDHLKLEVERCGEVPEELKESVLRGFGAGFLELLDKPKSTISRDALLLAQQLVHHAKTFNQPLPTPEPEAQEVSKLIVDPQQTLRATLKLIELRKEFLDELRRINHGTHEQAVRSNAGDSPPRHFASATRNLHHAVEWYQHLVANGL